MSRVVEFRSYNLKPGTRAEFHRIFSEECLPLLQRWKMEVVAAGPSLHDNDSYYLIRSYASLEDRQSSQDAFYGSTDWRNGPREAVLALIDNYATFVIPMDDATIESVRQQNRH